MTLFLTNLTEELFFGKAVQPQELSEKEYLSFENEYSDKKPGIMRRNSTIGRLIKPKQNASALQKRNSFISNRNSTNLSLLESDVVATATAANPIRTRTEPPTGSKEEEAKGNDTQNITSKVEKIDRFVSAMIKHEQGNINQAATCIQSNFRGYKSRALTQTLRALKWYGTTLYPPTIKNLAAYGVQAPHYKVNEAYKPVEENVVFCQHIVRGFLVRRRYRAVSSYNKAAIQIQALWRGYSARYKPPPHCPPLGGVVRSLATHRLALQKLAVKISSLSKQIQPANLSPKSPSKIPIRVGSTLSVQQKVNTKNTYQKYGNFKSPEPLPLMSKSFSRGRSTTFSVATSDYSSFGYEFETDMVSREEYNYLLAEMEALRTIVDALLIHSNS